MGRSPNKLDFSTVPDLDEDERKLLIFVFISTTQFLGDGTFPEIDTTKLADLANFSTPASANTAWYESKRKLKAMAKTLRPETPDIDNAVPEAEAQEEPPKAHIGPSQTSFSAVAVPSVAGARKAMTTKRKRRATATEGNKKNSEDRAYEKNEPMVPNTRSTRRNTQAKPLIAGSNNFSSKPATVGSNDFSLNEIAAGASTYARHTRGMSMAFGFVGELNILYDDPQKQHDAFMEDFGDLLDEPGKDI